MGKTETHREMTLQDLKNKFDQALDATSDTELVNAFQKMGCNVEIEPLKIVLNSRNPAQILQRASWQAVYDGVEAEIPKGLIRHPQTVSKKTGEVYDFASFTFPEIPARFYQSPRCETRFGFPEGKFVAQIGSKRWEILIDTSYDNGHPDGVEVTFEETSKEETPFKTEADINSRQDGKIFGQPCFLQSEEFPHHNGKSAFLLATIESGWGDSGNQNLFIALDENEVPCGIYYEYACC